jgi:hypothetical protein
MKTYQIKKWCRDHAGQSRRTLWTTSQGYKIQFADGSTYMYTTQDIGGERRRCEIYINGEQVRSYTMQHTGCGNWTEV